MTSLQAAVLEDDDDDECFSSQHDHRGYVNGLQSDQNPEIGPSSQDESAEERPLGYQYFLYDINIEYNPGGNHTELLNNKQTLKMKCLPYMVFRESDESSSPSDRASNYSIDERFIDVTKESCAFIGHSEYVPDIKVARRRVVIELISAKLSQPKTYNISANGNPINKIDIIPHGSVISSNDSGSLSESPPNSFSNQFQTSNTTPIAHPPTGPPLSSRRFVNYTILIKTAPGLDIRPAVIERRFSDFLQLYQGLKSSPSHAKIIDGCVSFPKKVLVGNFSLINIAERSIEFSTLLSLCILRKELLWSTPFVSFLLDKELREAQQLALCGDPDDCQALIESAYFIEQKLYMNKSERAESISDFSDSPGSQDSFTGRYSPILQNGRPILVQSRSNETISGESGNSNQANRTVRCDYANASPNQSVCDTKDIDSNYVIQEKVRNTSINQRILATFCILFIVYCRGSCINELKRAVDEFSQLISSQDFIDSLINTRQYNTLRSCLLFLMNINYENIIDEDRRMLLKRVLEDVDGLQATMTNERDISSQANNSRRPSRNSNNYHRRVSKDLTTLICDKNFCSFQDDNHAKY